MNTQFSNSNFGRILYVAIISLIVAATVFVIWYMTAGYKLGTYAPDTRLGSVYIGGLSQEEVTPTLEEKINYWYGDKTIVFELNYQGYTYEFNRNLFTFDVEASIYNIDDGVINEILVYYQGDDRVSVENEIRSLNFLSNVIDNIDLSKLVNDILYDASLMKSFSSKSVENYLVTPSLDIEVIGTSDFTIPQGVEIDVLITKINNQFEEGKIVVPGKELFDITDVFGANMNDAELSTLSSAMLSLLLETNFIVNEVHYEPVIDFSRYTIENYPYYARNSHVNKIIDESFSFYNPNESDYVFEIEKIDDFNGVMTLSGLPFEYEISIEIEKTELAYITERDSNIALLQEGYNGIIIEVNRIIKDINGNIIFNEPVLFEFYPPIKEIVFEP